MSDVVRVSIAGAALAGMFLLFAGAASIYASNTEHTAAVPALAAPKLPPDVPLRARAAVVMKAETGEVIFQRNADAQLPLASITKVMLAVVASEQVLPSVVTITSEAYAQEGESGFVVGEQWLFDDLLDFTLMTSSNDGAAALGEHVEAHSRNGTAITDRMNATAETLGLSQTYFLNPTGLDEHEQFMSGSYGSAYDVAHLFSFAVTNHLDVFRMTASSDEHFYSTAGKHYSAINTNIAIENIPGLLAGKTGFTDLAGGNLVVAFTAESGEIMVIAVLGSTREGRFEDVLRLREEVGKLYK